MECARRRYNLGHFHFTGHWCVEKIMTRFRIDGRTIKRGKLVLTPCLDTYPGSVESRSARKGKSDWSAGELPIRVVADEETAERG